LFPRRYGLEWGVGAGGGPTAVGRAPTSPVSQIWRSARASSEARRVLILVFPAACLISMAGCSGGIVSGAPETYEGGGPLPESRGVEVP
jgi:hypothetical protein